MKITMLEYYEALALSRENQPSHVDWDTVDAIRHLIRALRAACEDITSGRSYEAYEIAIDMEANAYLDDTAEYGQEMN
jgi:hypothetical protein